MPLLGGMAHDDNAIICPGHRPRHQNQVIFAKNFEHPLIHDSHAFISHLTRHPQALADAARKRAIADRSPVPEVFMSSARVRKTGKMMTFDHAGITMTLTDTAYVNHVAGLEHLRRRNHLAELDFIFAPASKLACGDSWSNV